MSQILDILGDNSVKVNSDYIISATKDFEHIDNEKQTKKCKILIFNEKWTFDDVLVQISKLDHINFPNLFIFIVKTNKINSSALIDTMKIFLVNFDISRSLILQIKIESESSSKFYYKEENCEHFSEVNEPVIEDVDKPSNFSQYFLTFLIRTSFDDLRKLEKIHNCPLIFKVLGILELPEEFLHNLVLNCGAKGSISDFFAITDGYINEKGAVNGDVLKAYVRCEFNLTSVLMTAVQHSNMPIIKFLIEKCSNLIQELSFDHQVAISTLALSINMIDILCDLLELSDYPFPENFNLTQSLIINERLQKIIEQREQFHKHVIEENVLKIRAFEKNHPKLKFAFSNDNKSALANALNSNKLKIFYLLKSLRFCDRQIETFEDKSSCDAEDTKNAKIFAKSQRNENVEKSEINPLKSVSQLENQSFIYKRDERNESSDEQRNKIKEWYEYIYKTKYGSRLLDAAAQCKKLKIIFDFECESTKNADASAISEFQGSTYPISKWIFIGAKISGEKEREQEIKGVIAHEICHYVMGLVYKNNDNPYYENEKRIRKIFDDVVTETGLILNASMPGKDNQPKSDECDGIISSVYTQYNKKDHHQELIVRPVQLQVQFFESKEKSDQLSEMYVQLFSFFDLLIIPELKKFCYKQRKEVQKFNNDAGLLKKLQELNLKLVEPNNLKRLLKNQLNIVVTNVPNLFLIDIHKYLTGKYNNMFDAQNIFITSNFLKNSCSFDNFKNITNQAQGFNIVIDCSKSLVKIMDIIGPNNKYIFVVSNEYQEESLMQMLKSKSLDSFKLNLNYKWMDLSTQSKINLLETKVNFQNNSSFSLLELIQNQESQLDQDFENIVDEKLLNLLLDKSKIVVNQFFEEDIDNKYIKIKFQSRSFIEISENDKPRKIEQDDMLNNSKKFNNILISDKGGAGKSWILKTFTSKLRIEHPKRWIAYIDSKQYIQKFKEQGPKFEFASFMATKIFELKTNFESEIFKKLYKNGNVSILFDGFDEIAPDCTEFVTKLFQSFQQNNGNQLWIATREFFEYGLKDKLGLNVVYKLHEFEEENAINLIASSCLFDELNKKGENYNEIFGGKYAEKLQEYKIFAKKLSIKIPKSKNDSIGLPQFYKMIADISSSDKKLAVNFTTLTIFEKCADIKYDIWSTEKGELRSNANVKSQKLKLNFHKLHQLIAMVTLFPEETEFGGLYCEEIIGWPDEEIIACSLLIKKNGKFLFGQETFREYYAAKFILDNLFNREHSENICKYLFKFLTIKKFKIIRMFLNDALGDGQLFPRNKLNISKTAKIFDECIHEFETSFHLFEENFLNLADLVIIIFTYSDKDKVKKVLKNKNIIILLTKHINLFHPIQDMILDNFEKDELIEFLLQDRTIYSIIVSIPDAETTKEFLNNVKLKTYPEFINKALKMLDEQGRNILFHFMDEKNVIIDKFKQIFELLKMYLTINEVTCLLANITLNRSFNQNSENEQFIWNELEKIITSENFLKHLVESLNILNFQQNFLHATAVCEKIEFHQKVWEVLLTTFINREELKKFLIQSKENEYNFIHTLVINNNSEIIEFELEKFKEVFNDTQYAEILRSKGVMGRNLLQSIASNSKKIEVHKMLWKIFRDLYISHDQFLTFLSENDNQNNNIFHIASCFTSKEIFEFMMKEVEKNASKDEIINILDFCKLRDQNVLQLSVKHNKCTELHEYLWEIIEKHFSLQQISIMIENCDLDGANLLFYAIRYSTKEILKLTWEKIKCFIIKTGNEPKFQEYLLCTNNDQECILHFLMTRSNSEELDFLWSEITKFLKKKPLKNLFIQKTNNNEENFLHYVARCEKIEFHKTLWHLILNNFDDHDELSNIMLEQNKSGNNFVHALIISNEPKIIEFTFTKINEKFNTDLYSAILMSKDQQERNILLKSLSLPKSYLKVQLILWKIIRAFFEFDADFLNFLKAVDCRQNNIFQIAAYYTSSEIFDFLLTELEKIVSTNDIRNFLNTPGLDFQNILQSSGQHNESAELHRFIWITVKKYFNPQEISYMIFHKDKYGNHYMHNTVLYNSTEIVNSTWKEIKEHISSKEGQISYLRKKGSEKRNLLQLASVNSKQSDEMQSLVSNLATEYNFKFKLDGSKFFKTIKDYIDKTP